MISIPLSATWTPFSKRGWICLLCWRWGRPSPSDPFVFCFKLIGNGMNRFYLKRALLRCFWLGRKQRHAPWNTFPRPSSRTKRGPSAESDHTTCTWKVAVTRSNKMAKIYIIWAGVISVNIYYRAHDIAELDKDLPSRHLILQSRWWAPTKVKGSKSW